jgi:adenosylmethionine-8-amino-7-oxononanoate aminotransferase
VTSKPKHLWPLMLPPEQHGLDELCSVSAQGVRVKFADGRERLCGTSGLWNTNLGYGNPAIAQAAADAIRDASYLSVWGYENSYARRAATGLVELAGSNHYARVMFSTSGGAANDMAMKLARHFHVIRGQGSRKIILGLHGGFHGLTFGAFALTTAKLGQKMYGVDRRLVGHIQPNDPAELATVLTRAGDRIAAVVVEPVIGTAAVPLHDEYVAELLRCRREYGFLIVADEVTTGFGRVGGAFFATQLWPEPPDILITAKGLTNGTQAASALIVAHTLAEAFTTSNSILGHAETQAGTPVVCATILATIAEMRRLNAVTRCDELSARLDVELSRMVGDVPLVSATTGKGCLRSLRLSNEDGTPLAQTEVPAVIAAIRDAGALVHPGPSCIQLLPALIYSDSDLGELLNYVKAGLTAYARMGQ